MAQLLRQLTEIDIRLGPFLDVTDGVTPELAATVTIAASDQAEVLKADGAATVAMTGGLTDVTGCGGWLDYVVQTTDVDVVGTVEFVMQDASVYLPVSAHFQVIEEAAYDFLFASGAAPVPLVSRAILPQINTAFPDLEFLMIDSADNISPKTGLTVTVTRSIDGGAFAAGTGTGPAEVGNGIYQYDASAADVNGVIITFRFAATGANVTFLTLKTAA